MTAGRSELVPAYVIHSRAYRDTSLLLEVFTPQQGRVSLIARGVKGGKQRRHAMLQPFRALHIGWTGRSELPTLTTVEEAGSNIVLQGQVLACGYYLNELIYRLLPRNENAVSLFAEYWPALLQLDQLDQRDQALRRFEITLLQQIGYSPVLDHDIGSGDVISEDCYYRYRVPDGPTLEVNPKQSEGLRIKGSTLQALASADFSAASTLREARDLLRVLLHHQLDGQELEARKLFRLFASAENGISQNTLDGGANGSAHG